MRNGKPKKNDAGARARSRARDELDDDDIDLFAWLDAEPDRLHFTKNRRAWHALARAGCVSLKDADDGGGTYVQAIVPPEVLGL
jgi:hypothetical protein